LAGLLALVIAYLGNCIPGFGVGGSPLPSTPSAPEPAPRTEAEPAKADAAAGLKLTVDGDRCRRGDEAPVPCDRLCREIGGVNKNTKVEIDGTLGTHASVDALRKCLALQGFRQVVVHAE
jgi:hypothetical protein